MPQSDPACAPHDGDPLSGLLSGASGGDLSADMKRSFSLPGCSCGCGCCCCGEPYTPDECVGGSGGGGACYSCGRRHRARRNGILSIRRRRNGVLSLRRRRNGVLATEEGQEGSWDGASAAAAAKRPASSFASQTLGSLDGAAGHCCCCCTCCCRGGVVSDGGEDDDGGASESASGSVTAAELLSSGGGGGGTAGGHNGYGGPRAALLLSPVGVADTPRGAAMGRCGSCGSTSSTSNPCTPQPPQPPQRHRRDSRQGDGLAPAAAEGDVGPPRAATPRQQQQQQHCHYHRQLLQRQQHQQQAIEGYHRRVSAEHQGLQGTREYEWHALGEREQTPPSPPPPPPLSPPLPELQPTEEQQRRSQQLQQQIQGCVGGRQQQQLQQQQPGGGDQREAERTFHQDSLRHLMPEPCAAPLPGALGAAATSVLPVTAAVDMHMYETHGGPRACLSSPVVRPRPPSGPSSSGRLLAGLSGQLQQPQPQPQPQRLPQQQQKQKQRTQQYASAACPAEDVKVTEGAASSAGRRRTDAQGISAEGVGTAVTLGGCSESPPPLPPGADEGAPLAVRSTRLICGGAAAATTPGVATTGSSTAAAAAAAAAARDSCNGGSSHSSCSARAGGTVRGSMGWSSGVGPVGKQASQSQAAAAARTPSLGPGAGAKQHPEDPGRPPPATSALTAPTAPSPSSSYTASYTPSYHRKLMPSISLCERLRQPESGSAAAAGGGGGGAAAAAAAAGPRRSLAPASLSAAITIAAPVAAAPGRMPYRVPPRRARSLATLPADRQLPRLHPVRQLLLAGAGPQGAIASHGSLLPLLHSPCQAAAAPAEDWGAEALQAGPLRPKDRPRRSVSTLSAAGYPLSPEDGAAASSPLAATAAASLQQQPHHAAAAGGRLLSPLGSAVSVSSGGLVAVGLHVRGWMAGGPSSRRPSLWSTATSALSDVEDADGAEGEGGDDDDEAAGGAAGAGTNTATHTNTNTVSTGGLRTNPRALSGPDPGYGCSLPSATSLATPVFASPILAIDCAAAAAAAAAAPPPLQGSPGASAALHPDGGCSPLHLRNPSNEMAAAAAAQQDSSSGGGWRQPAALHHNSWPMRRVHYSGNSRLFADVLQAPSGTDTAATTAAAAGASPTGSQHRQLQQSQLQLRATPSPPAPRGDAAGSGQGARLSRLVQPLRQLMRSSDSGQGRSPPSSAAASPRGAQMASDGDAAAAGNGTSGGGSPACSPWALGSDRAVKQQRAGAEPPAPAPAANGGAASPRRALASSPVSLPRIGLSSFSSPAGADVG